METVLDGICASCGNDRLEDGRFCLFCGDLLTPPAAATSREGSARVELDTPIEYAGFWLRFWAGAIDLTIEVLGALLLTLAIDFLLQHFGRLFGIDRWDAKVFAGFAYIPILAVGSWLYCAFMESSSWRATLGKRAFALQVMTIHGARTSFGQATARHFMKYLSLFSFFIGFFMSAWTRRRQALHDIPCECLVIRVPPTRFSLLGR